MPKTSAGILLYKKEQGVLQVFLVHPGGPYFVRKDEGAWSIPKGEAEPGEELLATALREFREETGNSPHGTPFALGQVKQSGGKVVHAFALEGDFDPAYLKSNMFSVETPKGSGRFRDYPEVDRAEWFDLPEARRRLIPAQVPLLDVLAAAPQLRSA